MTTSKEEVFHSTTQKDKEHKHKRGSQLLESEFEPSSQTERQNADCTCHTGRCACQGK